ncbi:hypothetical protein V6N12_050097 [Hibiscus sabdariffa]|uniref:Uncharacterized protein n=1 Tax=Hibiscus sabdariffa TaxID=183260 RepID=A0ABR2GCL5_9ROSI
MIETCAVGWVKEAITIRVLAQEMVVAGLDGFELMWVPGLMVLLSFLNVDSRGSLMSFKEMWSTWFGRLEECMDAATEEPSSFERAHILIETTIQWRIDEVVEIVSQNRVFPIVDQEVELVQVPAVE